MLFLLCAKNVHFPSIISLYLQNDGVAMGSILGLILAGIQIFELNSKSVSLISNYFLNWKLFVDDAKVYVKTYKVEYVLEKLNSVLRILSWRMGWNKKRNYYF